MDRLPPSLQRLVRAAPVKRFSRDKIIQYIDQPVTNVFVLKTGAIKIYDINNQGDEKILHIIKPSTVFPYAFYSGNQVHTTWFYSTLTDTEVYVLDPIVLRRAMFAHGNLAMNLLQDFSQDLHELLIRLRSLGKTNSRDKVVAALTFLAVCHAHPLPDGWWRVSFPVGHQLLADIAGITRESVAVVMKSLQTKQLIRNPRNTLLEINTQELFE
jgi:CRP/FNR family transcriptional regulator